MSRPPSPCAAARPGETPSGPPRRTPGSTTRATGPQAHWSGAGAVPFCSLWGAVRTAAEQAGADPRSTQMSALANAYLAPWRQAGHSDESIRRSLRLALRVAPLARALTWGRLFPCFQGHLVPAAYAARSLATLLKPDPLTSS